MPRCQPIPAVDIRAGRCVRLVQGDFSNETRYGDDPVAMALRWQAEGAQRLHIVDLDGARDGVRANADVIRRLVQTLNVPVQVGGGIRALDTARELIGQGADRVIVGTAAARDPAALKGWIDDLGAERVIVAVDARAGLVATHGWQHSTELEVTDFCQALKQLGVQRVLYTDVQRDGMHDGPNIAATRKIADLIGVIASGGISTVEHLCQLAEAGAESAIIGTALYTGRLQLRQALKAPC